MKRLILAVAVGRECCITLVLYLIAGLRDVVAYAEE